MPKQLKLSERLSALIENQVIGVVETSEPVFWISQHPVVGNKIQDASGKALFPGLPDGEAGILVFIDLEPEANWAHACRYMFVSAQRVERGEGEFPPATNIPLHRG